MLLSLILAQILYLLSLLGWLLLLGFSFLAFDSGVSTLRVILVSVIGIYPLGVIIASIAAWKQYRKEQFKPATWIMAISFG